MSQHDPSQDPFYAGSHHGQHFFVYNAAERVQRVAGFSRAQCLLALAKDDLQKTVRTAVERRLRQLDREAATC